MYIMVSKTHKMTLWSSKNENSQNRKNFRNYLFSLTTGAKIVCRGCWDLIVLRFLIKMWSYLGKVSAIEAARAWNKGISSKNLKITHNYLIFLLYYIFLLKLIIISISTEIRFDYIDISLVSGKILWENIGRWGSYSLKQGNPLQLEKKSLTTT